MYFFSSEFIFFSVFSTINVFHFLIVKCCLNVASALFTDSEKERTTLGSSIINLKQGSIYDISFSFGSIWFIIDIEQCRKCGAVGNSHQHFHTWSCWIYWLQLSFSIYFPAAGILKYKYFKFLLSDILICAMISTFIQLRVYAYPTELAWHMIVKVSLNWLLFMHHLTFWNQMIHLESIDLDYNGSNSLRLTSTCQDSSVG